jgi:class I fructose-bisphosphate aldolase
MKITRKVKNILSYYEADNAGVKANLASMLMAGKLGGTGKMVILPVDQGFEHGPARSFAPNPGSYDPLYHFQLAVDAGLSAYAAPYGMLAAGCDTFAGQIPLILKLNSANSLSGSQLLPDQAFTSTVKDALQLGAKAVGLTIYPGSDKAYDMMEEAKEISQEARSYGLPVVIWSYARGGDLSKDGETALDVIAYAAHIAALLGAHIIKVKPPTDALEQPAAKKVYEQQGIARNTLKDRIAHVMKCCFNGRRIVVFSGGNSKGADELYNEITALHQGGANGSIIGRNTFQRPRGEALAMLEQIIKIYKS